MKDAREFAEYLGSIEERIKLIDFLKKNGVNNIDEAMAPLDGLLLIKKQKNPQFPVISENKINANEKMVRRIVSSCLNKRKTRMKVVVISLRQLFKPYWVSKREREEFQEWIEKINGDIKNFWSRTSYVYDIGEMIIKKKRKTCKIIDDYLSYLLYDPYLSDMVDKTLKSEEGGLGNSREADHIYDTIKYCTSNYLLFLLSNDWKNAKKLKALIELYNQGYLIYGFKTSEKNTLLILCR
ncbi:MAG: hypothetical protein WCT16_05000 [Candidatus Buchananbacteria bacterium]